MRLSALKDPQRIVEKLRRTLKSEGMAGVVQRLSSQIRTPHAQSLKVCEPLLRGKAGFEIGGPSSIFRRSGLLPIYPLVGHLDNCNFGGSTVWEGSIREGPNFHYDDSRPPGYQYLREAVELSGIPSSSYDFVLSSHTLEHVSNPLRALQEWNRLLKHFGIIVLVVPHRDGTFDHRRPVTPFVHLVEDFESKVGEDDLAHLPEILRLHDLERDPPAGSFDEFRRRSMDNALNRCLHHHVFDSRLVATMMDYISLRIWAIEPMRPFHIIAIGQKMALGEVPDNRAFLSGNAAYCRRSPFASDRVSRSAVA